MGTKLKEKGVGVHAKCVSATPFCCGNDKNYYTAATML